VNVCSLLGHTLPCESGCPQSAAVGHSRPQLTVGNDQVDGFGPGWGVEGVDEPGGVAHYLGDRSRPGRYDWCTCSHRLERWQAEPLIYGRVHQGQRSLHQRWEVGIGDEACEADSFPHSVPADLVLYLG